MNIWLHTWWNEIVSLSLVKWLGCNYRFVIESSGSVNFAYQETPANCSVGAPVSNVTMSDRLTVNGQLTAGSLYVKAINSMSVGSTGKVNVDGGGYTAGCGPGDYVCIEWGLL